MKTNIMVLNIEYIALVPLIENGTNNVNKIQAYVSLIIDAVNASLPRPV
jgi:hypothetical protein